MRLPCSSTRGGKAVATCAAQTGHCAGQYIVDAVRRETGTRTPIGAAPGLGVGVEAVAQRRLRADSAAAGVVSYPPT